MGEAKHQPSLRAAFKGTQTFVVGFLVVVALVTLYAVALRRQASNEWFPYSTAAVAEYKADGKPSAVLYYARWTLSADPKSGLVTPAISQSLSDAGFVTMEADLTGSSDEKVSEFRNQRFSTIPKLVLYPVVGPRVTFDGGTPESEIVSVIAQINR